MADTIKHTGIRLQANRVRPNAINLTEIAVLSNPYALGPGP